MLMKVLSILSKRTINTITSLSEELGIIERFLKQILENLERMGFIIKSDFRSIRSSHNTSKCGSCNISCLNSNKNFGNKLSNIYFWELTEMGKQILK